VGSHLLDLCWLLVEVNDGQSVLHDMGRRDVVADQLVGEEARSRQA
jgi:hypothetical protein